MGKQITVREVNPKVFQEFKADAIRHGMTVGQALTMAMLEFRQNLNQKRPKFSLLKPVNWGKGTERVSEEIDSILYGE